MDRAVRAAQLADQIRDCVAGWASRDLPGLLFTVTHVTLTPDLREATLWVEALQEGEEAEIIAQLQRRRAAYQRELYRYLQRRSAPLLRFLADDRRRLDARLDALLKP